MKQELGPNQKLWLAALRSGEYEQNLNGGLRERNQFCCLGVACEVLGVAGFEANADTNYWRYGAEENGGFAPIETVEKLALRDAAGRPRDSCHPTCTSMNDYGKTFAEIADIIEADPGQYFTEPR